MNRPVLFSLLVVALACGQKTSLLSSSDLIVQRMDENRLPLSARSIEMDSDIVLCRYEFRSEDCLCHSFPLLVCNGRNIGTVTVNGRIVEPVMGVHVMDDGDLCFSLSGIVHDGENTIELKSEGGVPAVCLAGDFSVLRSEDGEWYVAPEKTLSPGLVASQGLPFYSGDISYSRQYEFPEKKGRHILRVPGWEGDACKVFVNGDEFADLHSGHFKKNVSPVLNPGVNYVEIRVTCHGLPFSTDSDFRDCGLAGDFSIE